VEDKPVEHGGITFELPLRDGDECPDCGSELEVATAYYLKCPKCYSRWRRDIEQGWREE